jgi:hypothetical protein
MSANPDVELEETIRDLLIELCAVMFRYGYQEISVAKMLMLLGVPDHRAKKHENEVFVYDESFDRMLKSHFGSQRNQYPMGNVTIH